MKKLYLLFTLVMPVIAFGQITIKNAEDFTIGTVLKFQECDTTGITAGKGGNKTTWDFSSLKSTSDTTTEWMVLPSSTPNGKLFPAANTVEKYSTGDYVYVNKTGKESSMLGYVSSKSNLVIYYPKPMVFAERPYIYSGMTRSPIHWFTDSCTSQYYSAYGKGTLVIEPDGYGTLILPNKKYNNVLRVKITQIQNDTIKQYNSFSKMVTVTYAWFNGENASALLKISTTHSPSYNAKKVEYLLSEVDGK